MTSSSEALKKRVEAVLDMAVTTVSSLTESFQSGASVLEEDAVVGKEIDHQNEPEDSGHSNVQESKLLNAETPRMDVVEGSA